MEENRYFLVYLIFTPFLLSWSWISSLFGGVKLRFRIGSYLLNSNLTLTPPPNHPSRRHILTISTAPAFIFARLMINTRFNLNNLPLPPTQINILVFSNVETFSYHFKSPLIDGQLSKNCENFQKFEETSLVKGEVALEVRTVFVSSNISS